jgi:hypothetical protein
MSGFNEMKAHGVLKGKSSKTPAKAVSVGYSDAVRPGLNSDSMALGRSMGVRKGRKTSKGISMGRSSAVRLSTGGHLGFEEPGDRKRYDMSSERDRKLEVPHYKRGGAIPKSMRAVFEALHSHFEKEPQMRKLGVKAKDVYESEPHHYRKKGGALHEELWIQGAINPAKKGALHRALHVPMGKKIPLSKIEKAEHSRSPVTRKRARLAETLRSFHHRGQR